MTWNYRLVRKNDRIGIHEVYYDVNGEVQSITAGPIELEGESLDDVLDMLAEIRLDLALYKDDIIEYDDIPEGAHDAMPKV